MNVGLAGIGEWPIAAWVIVLAAVLFVGEYVVLRLRQARHRATADAAERRLTRAAAALRAYADEHGQVLPDSLAPLGLPDSGGVTYRPVPRLTTDDKLILVHDTEPVHRVLEFPMLREGRGVVFCSGRLRVVTEAAWARLLEADDALRDRLGLRPVATEPGERVE